MTDDGALRRLDDRLVPGLQHATQSTVSLIGAPFVASHRLEKRFLRGRPYQFAWRRRRLVRTVVVLLALLGSAVHFNRYPDLLEARAAERAAALRQSVSQPDALLPADLASGVVVHGPTVGVASADYIADRAAVLASADDGVRLAVVSFVGFVPAEFAAAAIGSLDDARILRAQYRLPDVKARPLETEVVSGDVERSMERILAQERDLIVEEEESLAELLASGTMQDEAFEADARNRLDELRTIRNVLDATAAVVFSVVVRAEVEDLRTLAEQDGIRLVDLVPAEVEEEGSLFFGLRPDDVREVTFGVPARR